MDEEQRSSSQWLEVGRRMELSIEKQREYMRRILIARMSILSADGFFGLLLMHMKFALDGAIGTAATDGERIYFDPEFLDEISDRELIFVLMHEIMHVALRHTFRTGDRDNPGFNIACDIVVNSNILQASGMDPKSITLAKYGESMHTTPAGDEGYNYTAEEVYEMLPVTRIRFRAVISDDDENGYGSRGFCDDHSRWGSIHEDALDAIWNNRIRDAYEASRSRNSGKGCGTLPAGIEREIRELMEPKTDWRVLLNDFIQEEVTDYSFMPPDRRLAESPFFLPDFNDTETVVKDILFMIDTSASMSEYEITQAYSEIKGAIDQFDGRLEGWLGFFDAAVVPPKPFAGESEFRIIRPWGGGGTSFKAVFEYIRSEMTDREIASIIIMTDGHAQFPEESAAMGIPVLWMINNEKIDPPWGRIARIK